MIFSNIHHPPYVLTPDMEACLSYAQSHDLLALAPGSYPIDGERIFVNIVSYETTTRENRFWEAHRAYLDLHFMLDGQEIIDLGFLPNMEQKPYQSDTDFLPLEGEKNCSVRLTPGDFLVCWPEDGHRTAISVQSPQPVKKAIFKIKLP